MLRKLVKNIRQLIKKFTKSSLWFKLTVTILIILLVVVISNKYRPSRENFTQKKKFEMKQGPDVYDDFYANIYNDLVYDEIKNDYEVGEIVNATYMMKLKMTMKLEK